MEDAYRDRSVAAAARMEALEREVVELRERNHQLERERDLARSRFERAPIARHGGWKVVLGLVAVIGSILGAALWMALNLTTPSGPAAPSSTVPQPPSAPPVPMRPS